MSEVKVSFFEIVLLDEKMSESKRERICDIFERAYQNDYEAPAMSLEGRQLELYNEIIKNYGKNSVAVDSRIENAIKYALSKM